MKQFKFTLLLIVALTTIISSCDTGSNIKYVQRNKVLVLNEGNHLAQDGSVYVYDEDTKMMTPNAFAKANNNKKLGATLMSGTFSNYGIGYLLCSNPDKIEVINVLNMKTLTNPIEANLSNTREIALGGEFIFVTNAGETRVENPDGSYSYTESYVSVYNASNNNPVDTIHVGTDAHGMLYFENALYVGTKEGIVKLRRDGSRFVTEEVYQDEEYTGAVKHLCYYNNRIYASIPGYGVIEYDPYDDRTRNRFDMANCLDPYTGYITIDSEGRLYSYATDWDSETSGIYVLSLATGELEEIYSGMNLYSVGVSTYSGNLFTSEANGFATNSTMDIIDLKTGYSVGSQTTGIGTFRYLFFSYFEEDTTTEEK